MTTPLPIPSLADLTPRALPAWNALASYAGQPIRLKDGASATVTPDAAPPPDTRVAIIEPARGPRLVVEVASFPFHGLLGADLEAADLAVLPDGVSEAILSGLATLLGKLAFDRRLGAMRLAAWGRLADLVDESEAPRMAWWSATIEGLAPEPAALRLGCAARELVALVEADGIGPRRNWPDLRRRLTVDAFPTLGRLVLPLGQARELAPGALVVMAAVAERTVTLRAGEMLVSLDEAASGWTCTRIERLDAGASNHRVTPGDQKMSAEPTQGLPDEVIRALDVVLDFDLGHVAVPIAELESWAPGTVVALPLPSPEPGLEVTVRANGRAVATGDLVRIDDRIAVRLTRVALS